MSLDPETEVGGNEVLLKKIDRTEANAGLILVLGLAGLILSGTMLYEIRTTRLLRDKVQLEDVED